MSSNPTTIQSRANLDHSGRTEVERKKEIIPSSPGLLCVEMLHVSLFHIQQG